MSNNSNNIYNILGKLNALKPTLEEKRFALVKEIRESVEAKGSILNGVDAVQAKLQKQFAESQVTEKAVSTSQQKFMGMVHAAQKGEKAASPEVAKVAKSMGKKDARDFAATKHKGLPAHVETECAECAMGECSTHTDVIEAEITRTNGKTVHRKTDFPGYPADDTDDLEGLRGPGAGKRGRPRKHAIKAPKLSATGEKLGRGRPLKAAPVGANAPKMNDPFGRTPSKTPKSNIKGTVHTMAESLTQLELALGEMLSESRLIDEGGETLQHILNRFKHDVKRFEHGEDIYGSDLYDALFDYYSESGEMPYGTQKARDGDPVEWISQRLDAELGDRAYGKDPANAEGFGIEAEAIGDPQPGIPGNQPVPGKMDRLNNPRDYYEEEEETDGIENELNELARLAGLHSDSSQVKESFDQAQSAQPAFSLNTSIDSDGKKTVSVNAEGEQAEALLQMLKIAGLGDGAKAQELQHQAPGQDMDEPEVMVISQPDQEVEMDEDGIDVDQPEQELANEPHEKYGSIKAITTQGDDLNREKKQDPATANKAANPFTNPATRAQATVRAVAALESKLAEEYESIKKVSK